MAKKNLQPVANLTKLTMLEDSQRILNLSDLSFTSSAGANSKPSGTFCLYGSSFKTFGITRIRLEPPVEGGAFYYRIKNKWVAITKPTEIPVSHILNEKTSRVKFVPSKDFSGEINLNYQVKNKYGWSNKANLNLNINNVNDAPVLKNSTIQISEKETILKNTLFNITDVDKNDVITKIRIDGLPKNGDIYHQKSDGSWEKLMSSDLAKGLINIDVAEKFKLVMADSSLSNTSIDGLRISVMDTKDWSNSSDISISVGNIQKPGGNIEVPYLPIPETPVIPENTAPLLNLKTVNSINENAVNQAPVFIFNNSTNVSLGPEIGFINRPSLHSSSIFDSEKNFSGGSLIVKSDILTGEDIFRVSEMGHGLAKISVADDVIYYGLKQIAMIDSTHNGSKGILEIHFGDNLINNQQASAILNAITYRDLSDNPSVNRAITVSVKDSFGASDSKQFNLSVNPENDSPIISGVQHLDPVYQGSADFSNNGFEAKSLFSSYTDNDSTGLGDSNIGVAITGISPGFLGTWQYQAQTGAWVDIPNLTNGEAFLLHGSDLIRFSPVIGDVGSPSLSYRGWDGSKTTDAYRKVDVSQILDGGEFSMQAATASLNIVNSYSMSNPLFDTNLNGDVKTFVLNLYNPSARSAVSGGFLTGKASLVMGDVEMPISPYADFTKKLSSKIFGDIVFYATSTMSSGKITSVKFQFSSKSGIMSKELAEKFINSLKIKSVDSPELLGDSKFTFSYKDKNFKIISPLDGVSSLHNLSLVDDGPRVSSFEKNLSMSEKLIDGLKLFDGVSLSAVEKNQTINSIKIDASKLMDGEYEKISLNGIKLSLGHNETYAIPAAEDMPGFTVHVTVVSGAVGNSAAIVINGQFSDDQASRLLNNISYLNDNHQNPSSSVRDFKISMITDSGSSDNSGFNTFVNNSSVYYKTSVSISLVNDAPLTHDVSSSVAFNQSIEFKLSDFSFNDPDGDKITALRITQLPAHGKLYFDSQEVNLVNGTFQFSPEDSAKLKFIPDVTMNDLGDAILNYQVSDGTAWSNVSNFDLNIQPLSFHDTNVLLSSNQFEVNLSDLYVNMEKISDEYGVKTYIIPEPSADQSWSLLHLTTDQVAGQEGWSLVDSFPANIDITDCTAGLYKLSFSQAYDFSNSLDLKMAAVDQSGMLYDDLKISFYHPDQVTLNELGKSDLVTEAQSSEVLSLSQALNVLASDAQLVNLVDDHISKELVIKLDDFSNDLHHLIVDGGNEDRVKLVESGAQHWQKTDANIQVGDHSYQQYTSTAAGDQAVSVWVNSQLNDTIIA